MIYNNHCSVCDVDIKNQSTKIKHDTIEQNDDVSFAALLALVPVMTLTIFNLMGLI